MPGKSARSSNISAEIRKKYQLSVFLRSQAMHLLGQTFPLADLVVPPAITPPPLQITPEASPVSSSLTHQLLPYLPDWPEFMASYCVKPIPVTDLLRTGRNIALIGPPGSGKTFALAYLAGLVAVQNQSVAYLNNPLPILLHARDLIEFPGSGSTIQQLAEITSRYTPELSSTAINDLLQAAFVTGNVLLFLDGLDELPRSLIADCHECISNLLHEHPDTQIILTGPVDFLGGFIQTGFAPLAMSYWNPATLKTYLKGLCKAYFARVPADLNADQQKTLEAAVISWITQSKIARSPLEYTLQAVSLLAGMETGQTSYDIINSHINQMVPASATRTSLEVLAYQTIISQNPIINKYEIDHYVPELVQADPDTTPLAGTNSGARPSKALALVSKKIILQQTLKGNIFFTHPSFLGILASNALIRNGQCAVIFDQPDWAAKDVALRYLSHLIDPTQYMHLDALEEDAPLYRQLFSIAHWLGECKTGVIFRPQVMRRLAQIVGSENHPFSIRARAMAAIVFSNEKNISGLFRQYLLNGSSIVKILSGYACGIIQDPSIFKELSTLLADPDQHVRIAASSAIARINTTEAQDMTARILLQADEYMRRTVAEILTLNTVEGAQTLLDGSNHQDILVRRACTYGLGLINSDWSKKQLQKLQTEDGQWVIKNTAAQALENFNIVDAHMPRKLDPPHAAAWILNFATRNGAGLSPSASPIPLLLMITNQGTDEEKVAAIEYLAQYSEEGVIAKLFDCIYGHDQSLREYGLYALWRVSLTGQMLPAVKKYGFG